MANRTGKHLALPITLILVQIITSILLCTSDFCLFFAQMAEAESGTLVDIRKTAICFFDFQYDTSERFLEAIALMSHEYVASIKWIVVTADNPAKLEAALKGRNAVTEVLHDKEGKFLDSFGVMEIPTIILEDGDQVVYRHGKYSPAHNEHLAEVVSSFAQGMKIPEAYQDRVLKVGDYAPNIMLPLVSGETWSLSDYRKTKNIRPHLLCVFTIMNCEPCREVLRFLSDNVHLLQDTEVVVISFGPKKLTTSELTRMPVPFTVLCDENFSTYAKYHLTDTPTLVLTRDDIITYVGTGWTSDKEHEFLQAILGRQ